MADASGPAAPDGGASASGAAAALLELEQTGENLFRAAHNQDNHAGAIFGGQPLAQCLAAARRTVPGWAAHHCSASYLRGGDADLPVDYRVEAVRDGRRFAARRVLASQAGRPIFDALCSFHDEEPGLSHQMDDIGAVPAPETLPTLGEFSDAHAARLGPMTRQVHALPFPVELRLTDPEQALFGAEPQTSRSFWARMPSAAGIADPADHACLLAFLSDYWLAGTPAAMHRSIAASMDSGFRVATLNHAIWLHAPVRVDEWLLHRTDTPWAGGGRGLARGLIYTRDGTLVATTSQEVTMRQGRAD